MNTYIYIFYNFHSILTIPKEKIINLDNQLFDLIPIEWQLTLINEGSFTKNLYYLNNKKINIKICQKINNCSKKINRIMRCIWLENSIYTKFIFARSLWLLKYTNDIEYNLHNNQPIGTYFIQSQIDIYKNIHEIYYGYSKKLENNFKQTNNKTQAIWGRKYTLHYKNISYITIQEFFSPNILNLFY